MRGSSTEVLMWITYHHEYAEMLQMTRQRLVGLRHKLRENKVSEEKREMLLEKLQKRIDFLQTNVVRTRYCSLCNVRKIRDKYILPAVVKDHHGKFFSELTFIKMVAGEEKMRDLKLEFECRVIKRGDFPKKEVVREALNRKGWSIFEERMELPSVWEVEYDFS